MVSPQPQNHSPLIDRFSRRITYLRVSVTDRCDFRCVYCMTEDMNFLPKAEILSLEEIYRICSVFIRLGVRKLRLTGGEPLVRRGIMSLFESLGEYLKRDDLEDLTLTTNGSQLSKYAQNLVQCGIRRVNVSLDTLDEKKFFQITRGGNLKQVLQGLDVAQTVGLNVKINCVVLKGINDEECEDLMMWCQGRGVDLTFIEVMPMGEMEGQTTRLDQYFPLSLLRARLKKKWRLQNLPLNTGGPARYVEVVETGQRLGFITPLTHNFCASCNRVRLTCTGILYMCLGQEDAIDLKPSLRRSRDDTFLIEAISEAIQRKPKGHDFYIDRQHSQPAIARHMSVTGG